MEEDVERQFSDPRSYYTIIKAVLKPGDGKPVFRVIVPPCAISTSLALEDMYPASYLWGPLNGHFEESEEEDGRSGSGSNSQQHTKALGDSQVLFEYSNVLC